MGPDVPKTILVVDDSPEDCGVVRRYLESGHAAGEFVVAEAHTGRAALARIAAAPPTCLVLDYDLPDTTGVALLERLTGPDGTTAVPVVVLTGQGSEAIAVRAIKLGAQDYLVKGAFTAEVFCQTVRDAIRKADLAAQVARERAENARLIAELAEANRNKDDFIALLAHELRNPLAPIRTGLEILRRTAGDQPAVERPRAMMARQLDHMVRLVDDLLDVSRIARGKFELRREAVDLVTVLARAAEAARPRMDDRGHKLELDLPPHPLLVEGDPARLDQIFGNLLTNAAKYTEPGGRVCVSARAEEEEAAVRVRDTGIGIRPEMVGRIFDMFAQADRAAGALADGLGLGLSLVRGLCELHGGRVGVHSDGPGRGSEFVVHLPLLTPAPCSPGRTNTPPEDGRSLKPLKVLVVDDNVDAAVSLAELLRLIGPYEVRTAHDGATGLAAAADFCPDVALLDVAMPHGMDGYELALRIRGTVGLERTALVLLTGFGRDSDRQRSSQIGVTAHLVKPVDPSLLSELLATI
ncbi:response regulator [Gemmata sp. JC673]|uniref:histidine kinase n=1 Tax=Gemmata algarum TaxID=2975278 RepID=A0ABU5F8D7_9BACT|nr:response regulator [Gemmata algarum]MDY3562633.1 response regulator [Gemmata algarum]